MAGMRFFNTSGPVVAADHYCVPPLARLDLDEILTLVRQKRYFVLHAPRQTGKTSALLALRDLLNGGAVGEDPASMKSPWFEPLGYVPPAAFEAHYYHPLQESAMAA